MESGLHAARVVWQRWAGGVDVALLEVTDPGWAVSVWRHPVRWGRLVTSRVGQVCEVIGFFRSGAAVTPCPGRCFGIPHAFDHAAQPCQRPQRPTPLRRPRHHQPRRWRGHALARFGDPDATTILTNALNHLDPTFVRAETALRVDLATSLAATGQLNEARTHADRAIRLAAQVGSARQRRRIKTLRATIR